MASIDRENDYRSIALSALKAGGFAGIGGLLLGGTVGLLRTSTPILFTVTSTIRWALLGSTYWGLRGTILHNQRPENRADHRMRLFSSALAGAVAVPFVGVVMRGRKKIILPGAIAGTIFGYAAQSTYNFLDARHTAAVLEAAAELRPADPNSTEPQQTYQPRKEQKPLLVRIGDSKWSPYTILSDAQYADMLREQLMHANVEISVLDDDIRALRQRLESPGKVESGSAAKDGEEDGDETGEGARESMDLARRLRDPRAKGVEMREDEVNIEQVQMARRLRERLKRREG